MKKKQLMLIIFLLLFSARASVDLSVSQINFSNLYPVENENIVVNAIAINLGDQNVSNVTMIFLDDSRAFGNATVSIPASSNISISLPWKAEIGPNLITASIDANNVISEVNEINNEAAKKLSINAYQTYFGKARTTTALGINFDFLFGKEEAGCNILVSDTDSNVDFSALQALGRRENNLPALNDFINLDAVFNMTTFDDSITSTWTLYGNFPNFPFFKTIPKEVEIFTVFTRTIPAVPVINSTNSSTFQTGILWDTSDNIPPFNRQFDTADKEDLVFITKINQSNVGKYGIYDYEIKIPALLRDYKPGSSTVDFFIDFDPICS